MKKKHMIFTYIMYKLYIHYIYIKQNGLPHSGFILSSGIWMATPGDWPVNNQMGGILKVNNRNLPFADGLYWFILGNGLYGLYWDILGNGLYGLYWDKLGYTTFGGMVYIGFTTFSHDIWVRPIFNLLGDHAIKACQSQWPRHSLGHPWHKTTRYSRNLMPYPPIVSSMAGKLHI